MNGKGRSNRNYNNFDARIHRPLFRFMLPEYYRRQGHSSPTPIDVSENTYKSLYYTDATIEYK